MTKSRKGAKDRKEKNTTLYIDYYLFPEITLENARRIVGFRNRLIHSYDAVDSSMIWAIIKRHLDPLKAEVSEMIK